ncbi:hypothetical protein SAMN05428944_0178 [Streptomyces sp. 1222.5]|nr:hypothetical protein BX260_0175 [Streptomyces sp. 5112.2]SEB54748.1 hypothetical protein SAMN05428944_0178 [Streptomyces sp. 1222.5]
MKRSTPSRRSQAGSAHAWPDIAPACPRTGACRPWWGPARRAAPSPLRGAPPGGRATDPAAPRPCRVRCGARSRQAAVRCPARRHLMAAAACRPCSLTPRAATGARHAGRTGGAGGGPKSANGKRYRPVHRTPAGPSGRCRGNACACRGGFSRLALQHGGAPTALPCRPPPTTLLAEPDTPPPTPHPLSGAAARARGMPARPSLSPSGPRPGPARPGTDHDGPPCRREGRTGLSRSGISATSPPPPLRAAAAARPGPLGEQNGP